YDLELEIERIADGRFWYQKPDKGRIDVEPVKITPSMIQQREQGAIPARMKADGKPFTLKPGKAQKSICDGQRVYEIDEAAKTAHIANLPAQMMGDNIMDSPLPFLFGMPPEKAKERFRMELFRETDRANGRAYIRAYPRTNKDSGWVRAEIILDLRQYLPVAVQLTNNTGNELKCYAFGRLKVNESQSRWLGFGSRDDVFRPNLKDYQVIVVGTDEAAPPQNQAALPGNAAPGRPVGPVVPNLVGKAYQDALAELQALGLPRDKDNPENNRVSVQAGQPARVPADVYRVEKQSPQPGTPILPGTRVTITLLTKPGTTQQ
ncbi:MAG: PASTA domain-containing protein, partial [Planctomycetaceae bacterium]|nr:PASTA domain-containing protein [Planctomycetaceae bacterium]